MTLLFVNPPPRMCLIDFRDRLRGWGEREKERERERDIIWLPPVRAPTQDQNHNLLVCGMMLQPAEPHGQGFLLKNSKLFVRRLRREYQ